MCLSETVRLGQQGDLEEAANRVIGVTDSSLIASLCIGAPLRARGLDGSSV